MAGLFVNNISAAFSGHKHIDYDDRIRFTNALDQRAIVRFAYLYLAKKYNVSPYLKLTSKSGKLLSRWRSFILQDRFRKARSKIGKDYDSEKFSLNEGLSQFSKDQIQTPKLREEVDSQIKLLIKEMKNVINRLDFNFIVSNTATKDRGESADYTTENSFYEINFGKENKAGRSCRTCLD